MAAARRLSKTTIDWAKFAEKIPKDEWGHFQQLKAKAEGFVSKSVWIPMTVIVYMLIAFVFSRVATYPEALPEIDFKQFKSRAGAMASVVEQFEKAVGISLFDHVFTSLTFGFSTNLLRFRSQRTQAIFWIRLRRTKSPRFVLYFDSFWLGFQI